MIWPLETGWPASTERFRTTPARGACTSFSIFIASTMQITWPGSTSSPVGDRHREHRSLHRRDDRVAAAGAVRAAPRPLAPPLGERAPLRLRLADPHLEPPPVDLDRADALDRPPEPAL